MEKLNYFFFHLIFADLVTLISGREFVSQCFQRKSTFL